MSGTAVELRADYYQNSKAEEMLKFFFQLVHMTKHMMDDLLPDILMGIDRQTLEQMIGYCEEFNCSLQVFVKLCGVISRKNLSLRAHVDRDPIDQDGLMSGGFVASETLSDKSSKDRYEDHYDLSKTLISTSILDWASEQFDEIKTIRKFYYCGLCDVKCVQITTWRDHCKGKNHIKRCEISNGIKMACDVCGLHIFAQSDDVAMIIESPKHQMLDEKIAREFHCAQSHKANMSKDMDDNAHEYANDRKIVRDLGECWENAQLPQNDEHKDTPIDYDETPSIEPKIQSMNRKGDVFEGKTICTQFVECNSLITRMLRDNNPFRICYCRPCEVIAESMSSWRAHCESSEHQSKMKNKAFNNVACSCLQCQFSLVASKKMALCYMHFHIEKCHEQCTVGIVDEEYMSIVELTPKVQNPGFTRLYCKKNKSNPLEGQSFKGSTETVHSSSSRPSSACSTHSFVDKSQDSSHRVDEMGGTELPKSNVDEDIDRNADNRKIVGDLYSTNSNNDQLHQNYIHKNAPIEFKEPPCVEFKAQCEEQVFEGKTICTQFVECNSLITRMLRYNNPFRICYCRPCEVIAESMSSWRAHCESSEHQSKMKNKAFNNVACSCLQCQFALVASKEIALCYMHFHIEKCHGQSTVGLVDEECMSIMYLTPKVQETERRRQENTSNTQEFESFKGSTETVDSSRPSSACSTHSFVDKSQDSSHRVDEMGGTELPKSNVDEDIDCNADNRKIVGDLYSTNSNNDQLHQNYIHKNAKIEFKEPPCLESKAQYEEQVFEGKTICTQFVECNSLITRMLRYNNAFRLCYCRPCEVIAESMSSWSVHCESAEHQSKMDNKALNHVVCSCLQCQFSLVASKKMALCYMHFHIEKCHEQCTVGIVDEEYMSIVELKPKGPNSGFTRLHRKRNKSKMPLEGQSFKGSTETVHSSRPSSACSTQSFIDKSQASSHQDALANNNQQFSGRVGQSSAFQSYSHDNTTAGGVDNESRSRSSGFLSRRSSVGDGQSVREMREGQCSPNSYESQPIAGQQSQSKLSGSSKMNQTSGEPPSSGSSHCPGPRQGPQLTLRPAARESAANSSLDLNLLVSDPVDPVVLFTELLKLKESKFLMDRSFNPFSALCLICKKNVLDLFQWYDHISTHESNDEQHEVECSQCNTFLFGNVREINHTLIPLPYHVTVDNAMAR